MYIVDERSDVAGPRKLITADIYFFQYLAHQQALPQPLPQLPPESEGIYIT